MRYANTSMSTVAFHKQTRSQAVAMMADCTALQQTAL